MFTEKNKTRTERQKNGAIEMHKYIYTVIFVLKTISKHALILNCSEFAYSIHRIFCLAEK